MHEIMEFSVTSSALDNWQQNIVKLLVISQTIHTVCWEDDYLRSHVLRAYCNKHFESKQGNSITIFGRRPNN